MGDLTNLDRFVLNSLVDRHSLIHLLFVCRPACANISSAIGDGRRVTTLRAGATISRPLAIVLAEVHRLAI